MTDKPQRNGQRGEDGARESAVAVAETVGVADREATHRLAAARATPPMRVAEWVGEIADQPQMIATSIGTIAAGLVTRRSDLVRGGARMLAAHLVATAIKTAIKRSFDRTRPKKALADGAHHFAPGDSHDHDLNSFPSGHTAGAVAVARAAARDIEGATIPATLGAVGIAALQPATGHHYLSDVVVGAAVGWIAEAAVSAVFDRVEPLIEDRLPALAEPD